MSWLEDMFCAEVKKQLEKTQTEKEELQRRIDELENSLQESNNQHSVLLAQHEAQEAEFDRLKAAYDDIVKAMGKSVNIPDISGILSQAEENGVRKQIDPPNEKHPTLNKMYGFIYEIVTSDNYYYAYNEATWRQILELVHPEVKKAVGFGSGEVSDCDNYAYTTAIFTALAFNKAGSRYQGAIGVAEGHYDPAISTTHAFNVILLDDNIMMTVEPYSNRWLGKTDDVNNDSLRYKVRKINFAN